MVSFSVYELSSKGGVMISVKLEVRKKHSTPYFVDSSQQDQCEGGTNRPQLDGKCRSYVSAVMYAS
jgi:hypothetical protein